jgi:tetratricopeptide (TPR) repeat protein
MTFLVNTSFGRVVIAAALTFVVALVVLSARGDDPVAPRASAGADLGSLRGASAGIKPDALGAATAAEIRRLQAAVRRSPAAAAPRVALADAYLQRVRETGDPGFYGRAESLLRGVLARDADNADALVSLGGLALSRHDFRRGLELVRRADAGLAALPFEVDALVELGRYGEARRVLQRLADLKPNLSTYARVSYFRELHGDLRGAASALALASAAGGPAAENAAAIDVLRGDLALVRARPAEARAAYARALAAVPRYAPAEAGRARLAAYEGNARDAVRRWNVLVARLPLPEYVIGLGEAELAAGRVRAAREDFALVRVQQRLLARAGVNTDVELAVFESDHGDRARGLRLARQAWAAAPSVRSADAVGWALTRSGRHEEGLRWARRARRLGSADPLFAFHAGMAARGAERQRLLRFALDHGLGARPWHAQLAREALR